MTELIGKEIYDEFDPHHEGAQLSSFIPPDSDAGVKVTAIGPNDPDSNHLDHFLPTAGHDGHSTVGSELGQGHGLTIVKPIALRAMEGLGLLTKRSRSAPPIHRDQVGKQPPSKSGVSPKTGDNNEPSTLPGVGINEKIDMSHLDPHTHLTNQMFISGAYPQEPRSQPQTPLLDSAVPHTPTFNSYLVERERKRKAASGGGTTPRIVTPVPVRGKGFKSNPLPAEMDVAENLMNEAD